MLKLLTCAQGHYWEKPAENGADGQPEICPVCGQTADVMPLFDLAPSESPSADGTAAPTSPASSAPPLPLRDKDGRPVVAGYEILQDLGKGPTGVHHYRARQLLVNRIVLLKVVFAHEDPSQRAWGSLRNEAGALGRLADPHIVQVLDAGERERQLFYNAIEYVDGPTLAETLDGKPLPFRQAAALVETLARTMHHAHDKNILHRSLKPASILLTSGVASAPREGAPRGANAAPLVSGSLKITDFGLARRPVEGDTSDVDLQGEWPCYLAPEQAWGRAKEIGPATDVYALGAILHELITGQPPFRADTPIETLDAIQFREVPPLYRLRRRVPGDLDAICRKCLAKQPRRRYASALELAEDLHRYTNRYPIAARTASNVERFGKCLRRNLRIVALVLLLLWAGVSLLALFAGSGQPQTARPSREAAFRDSLTRLETELAQSRRRQSDINYLNCLLKVERALANGEPQRIEDLLTRCPVQSRNWEWYYLRARHQGAKPLPSFSNDLPVAAVDVSRDGRYLAIAGGELRKSAKARGEVSLWDLATRQRVQRWTVDEPIRGVAFSDDTTQVAFVSSAGSRGDSEIQVRAVPAGQLIARRREPGLRLSSIAYSPNQTRLLLACGDGSILSVPPNLKDEPIATPVAFHGAWRVGEMRGQLLPLAPDPDRLALISPDGGQVAIIEDTRQGSSHTLRGLATTTLALAYDPHHWTLATAGRDQTIRLWEVSFPFQSTGTLRGHQGAVTGVSFTRDGERLASCGEDGTVRIWNAKQEVELLTLKERFKDASGVLFAPTEGGQGMPGVNRLVIVHDKKVTVIEPR